MCLDEIGGALRTGHKVWVPPRQYNRSLMCIFASWKLSNKEMDFLDRVHIYLQVIFVLFVMDYEGLAIVEEAFEVVQFRDSILR